jgi:hypothetical protein
MHSLADSRVTSTSTLVTGSTAPTSITSHSSAAELLVHTEYWLPSIARRMAVSQQSVVDKGGQHAAALAARGGAGVYW